MAKGDAADRLNKMRKANGFAPVWSFHAEHERLPKHGLDKLSCERIVKSGRIHSPEINSSTGRDNVHVRGKIDSQDVDIVVDPYRQGEVEVVVIVTIKPK